MVNETLLLWASVSLVENEEVKLDLFHNPLFYKIRNCSLKGLLRWFLCTLTFAKLQSRGFLVICLIQISDSVTARVKNKCCKVIQTILAAFRVSGITGVHWVFSIQKRIIYVIKLKMFLFLPLKQNRTITTKTNQHMCGAVLCLVAQSCPSVWDPMDCSPPGSSVHGDSPGKNTGVGCHALLQGIFLTQGSNCHLLQPPSPALAGIFFTTSATWEALCGE